jgi:3-isopropylmalate/(R)-2-methylmalate dehydratase large subunit
MTNNTPRTLAEKVWEAHLVAKGKEGEPDLIYVDLAPGPRSHQPPGF